MPTYTTNNGMVWKVPGGQKRKGLKKRLRAQEQHRKERLQAIEARERERQERQQVTATIQRMYRREIEQVRTRG